jgi:two-component system NarL family sensor kinase
MYKSLIFFFLGLFITSRTLAQTQQRAALIQKMAHAPSDTQRVIAYYQYGDLLGEQNKDSARFYYEKGKQLARHYNNDFALAVAHGYEIPWLNDEGKYAEALQLCLDAEQLFKKVNAPAQDLSVVYINIANEWQYLGDFKKASDNYFKGLQYAITANKQVNQALILNNIATLYAEMGDNDNSLKYAIESKKVSLAIKDSDRLFSASYTLAEAYFAKKMLEEGKKETEYVEALFSKMNRNDLAIDVLTLKADYALNAKKEKEAVAYFRQILALCEQADNKEYELVASRELAKLESKTGNHDEARKLIQRALSITREAGALKEEADCVRILSDIEANAGQPATALQLRKHYETLADSLGMQESHKNVQLLEINFETEKKQLLISQLTKETQIQQLKNRQRMWIIGGLLFGLLCLSGFIFAQYKNQQHKQQLVAQEDELKEQKIEQLKTEHQLAIAEERLRIAGDMHDDVGAGLSRIRYITSSLSAINEISDETIQKIVSLADDSVEKMNEIIWALNQGNQKLEDLIYYIRSQAAEMTSNADIDFVCELPNHIPDITFGWKENRNTYLLIKEAVNNAIKHSGASLIAIDIAIGNTLNISVTDNGKGFDPSSVRKDGYGLHNYKKRTDNLHGTFQLDTVIGQGTTLHFTIPLNKTA